MAIAYVTGQVEKVLTGAYGVGLIIGEAYKGKDGAEKVTRYAAWFDEDPGTPVGHTVTVSGFISVKVEAWTGTDGVERHSAKVSLNKAKVSGQATPQVVEEDLPF